jgi:hypothetical protein
MRPLPAIIVLGALLASCATPYGEMGPLGGVRGSRISEDVAQITASGNAYTDADTIQRFALRRAAEETVLDGFDLFRIIGRGDQTRTGTQTTAFATGRYNWATGFGYSMPVVKPGETLMIKMIKGPRPDPMPDGEFDAHEVLKFIASADANSDRKHCAADASGRIVCQ